MLGTVVLKHAVQLLHAGAKEHVAEEYDHLEHALEDYARPAPQRHSAHDKTGQKSGQKGKQEQRQRHAHKGGAGHQRVLHGGGGVRLEPFVQLGLSGLGLALHGDVGRVHQVAVALVKVFRHVADAPDQRDLIVPVGRDGVIAQVDGAVRLAHGAADLLRAAHHDALHQGLSPDGGAEFFGHMCSPSSFLPSPEGEGGRAKRGRMRGGCIAIARYRVVAESLPLISPLRGQLPPQGKP